MKVVPVNVAKKNISVPCYVDDVDYEKVRNHNWTLAGGQYAFSSINGKTVLMHRMILTTSGNHRVDHIDHDGLNNRRDNLRSATHSQNQYNRRIQRNNTSGYKGVFFNKAHGKWRVKICSKGKQFFLGSSDNKINCVLAYRIAAKELHGEYARF